MNHLDIIVGFLGDLGFTVRRVKLAARCFVNGVYSHGMTMSVDPDALLSPGDLLHEAGHVAVVPSVFRDKISGDVVASLMPHLDRYFHEHDPIEAEMQGDMVFRGLLQCGETEAIAWSYAAAMMIEIPPQVVFHDGGYEGKGEVLISQLAMGQHFGVNGLKAAKMTTLKMYPAMLRWLQV